MKRVFVAAALLALAGCHKEGTTGEIGRESLALRSVEFNPQKADLGKISAVTDQGQSAVVFGDKGATVLLAGAVSGGDGSITTWSSAGVIPAADGEGEWMIGVGATGEVYTLDASMELQSISDRYGLLGQEVRAAVSLGAPGAAFLLDKQIAVADGKDVTRYDLPVTSFAGAKGRIAGLDGKSVHVFDPKSGKDSIVPIAAAYIAFDNEGKVIAATKDALYAEDDSGALIEIGVVKEGVRGLASSPSGVWIAAGSELALLSPDHDSISISSGAAVPEDAAISGSSSGDVWALSATKGLLRYSAAKEGDESTWQQTVLPVFTRVCSQCHLPGGSAGIDLSFYGAWVERRAQIGKSVVDRAQPVMPPSGAPQLTDAEIAAVKAWVEGQ
jgi:mono/diheme cytochrome c family protein